MLINESLDIFDPFEAEELEWPFRSCKPCSALDGIQSYESLVVRVRCDHVGAASLRCDRDQ